MRRLKGLQLVVNWGHCMSLHYLNPQASRALPGERFGRKKFNRRGYTYGTLLNVHCELVNSETKSAGLINTLAYSPKYVMSSTFQFVGPFSPAKNNFSA